MYKDAIESLFVRETDTLLSVIKRMDDVGTGYVLVVDDERRCVGVAVDSDIRRALIRGDDLECRVGKIMTRDFISIPAQADEASIVRVLQGTSFASRFPRAIPALDPEGRVVRLYTSTELLEQLSLDAPRRADTRNVLVIGGAGYIGSMLTRRLIQFGYSATVLDRLLYGGESIEELSGQRGFRFVQGDTRHINDLVAAIRDADAVVHLAELVGDPLCARDPTTTLEINYLATTTIARICSCLQVNRLVYMSSCSVYGASSDPDAVLDENSGLSPVSLYAKTKIDCERAIMGMSKGNFSPCILRLATVFGMSARPRFDLVVNAFSAKAAVDGAIEIFGGRQWRPHVHVSDVVSAICAVLQAPIRVVGNEVFNVVGENKRITDLAEVVKSVVPEAKLNTRPGETDPRNYRVAGAKIEEALGFKAGKSIEYGVREIVDAVRSGLVEDYRDSRYYNISPATDEGYGGKAKTED